MVVATAAGTVTAVNDDGDYGHNIWVDHGNGYVTNPWALKSPLHSDPFPMIVVILISLFVFICPPHLFAASAA